MTDKSKQALPANFGLNPRDIPLVDEPAEIDFGALDSGDFDIPILTDIAADPAATQDQVLSRTDHQPEAADYESPANPSEQALPPTEDNDPAYEVRQPSLFEEFAAPGSMEAENLDRIIDELVFEYLPRLEHELRIRLYDHLIGLGPKSRNPGAKR